MTSRVMSFMACSRSTFFESSDMGSRRLMNASSNSPITSWNRSGVVALSKPSSSASCCPGSNGPANRRWARSLSAFMYSSAVVVSETRRVARREARPPGCAFSLAGSSGGLLLRPRLSLPSYDDDDDFDLLLPNIEKKDDERARSAEWETEPEVLLPALPTPAPPPPPAPAGPRGAGPLGLTGGGVRGGTAILIPSLPSADAEAGRGSAPTAVVRD
mmetsp:Transcript_51617/g.144280  ORF Transcript_51617/g.144280 Transcript_51617/m.144280 type:complete len:216 (-) Transcript_51617:275-922(-)